QVYVPYLKRRGVRLAIAGSICSRMGINDHTLVKLGYVDDLDRLYASAKMVIAPIRYGAGCNIKLLEAMSYGKPIIATSKAFHFSPCNRTDGLLIEDDPAMFGERIIEVLSSREKLSELSTNSLKFINAYHSQDRYDKAMDDVFGRILE
ncbi:MAG TPA: glycosyltransferase family 4 protein, partial [Thermodesulfovibrionales bacterium]|nr:glycosyltransferase family 4 protein [Thermodesulfovibrionales bacterium]